MRKTEIEIIYSDKDIIVINKPPGISATKDRAGLPDLLVVLPKQLEATRSKLRLVHRLDKDTSGVMICARHKRAQTEFAGYFFSRLVRKTYLALVKGAVMQQTGTIDSPIAGSRRKSEAMWIDEKNGRHSITHYRLLADFGLVSLLAVQPHTGRTHQIRVHLASIGLPLAIDPIYGGTIPIMLSDYKARYKLGDSAQEKPLIDRLTLHAYQLEIPPTCRDRPTSFVAPLDKKFAATIKLLTKHNSKGLAAFVNPNDYAAIMAAKPLPPSG